MLNVIDLDSYLIDNKWHNCHFVCDSNKLKLFVDGILASEKIYKNPQILITTKNKRK